MTKASFVACIAGVLLGIAMTFVYLHVAKHVHGLLIGSQWRCTFVVVLPGDPHDGQCLRWDRERHPWYSPHAKGSNYRTDAVVSKPDGE